MGMADLVNLGQHQHGVLGRGQAYDAGFNEQSLRRLVSQGRLTQVAANAFVFPGSPETWHRRLMAGMLDLGDNAFIAFRSAAVLLGYDGYRPGPLEYLMLDGTYIRRPGLIVHRTKKLPLIDRTTLGAFRLTSGARTVIDLASIVTRDQLADAVDSCLRDGFASEIHLLGRLRELRGPGRGGPPLLDEVLSRRPMGGPMASKLERTFVELVRSAGLPLPRTQVVHDIGGGSIVRVDCLFGDTLVVELIGHYWHLTRSQQNRDAVRRAKLEAAGRHVIEFTSDHVFWEPSYVLDIMVRALGSNGALRSAS
jgi:very-short-patch-repair endonuclease